MWIKVNVDDVVMKFSVFIPLGICFSVFYISIHGQTAHLWFYQKKKKNNEMETEKFHAYTEEGDEEEWD